MNRIKGKFIVFEGLDGSGQTTQSHLLRDFLKSKGFPVVLTKEPTLKSKSGKKIKRILQEEIKVSPLKLQELFAQDREHHLKNLILPSLRKGKIVICDRYLFSSYAYGSINLDLDYLKKLNKGFILPDIVFFLDVSPNICIDRIKKRNADIDLFEKTDILKKVYKNYHKIFKDFKNVYIIEGGKSIEEVFTQIKEIIIKIFHLEQK